MNLPRSSFRGLGLLPLLLVAAPRSSAGEASPQPPPANTPPTVRVVGLSSGQVVPAGSDLHLRIEVDDADGDAVSLRLLNPPAGMAFPPLFTRPSPAVREVTWTVLGHAGGWQHLVFQADDGQDTTRLVLPLRIEGDVGHAGHLVGDVTGDGVLDLVVGASQAVVGGVRAAGAVYVWPGGTSIAATPATTLHLAQPTEGDQLGLVRGPGIQLVDVTGDGVLDVVVGGSNVDVGGVKDVGAIAVWAGGPALASGAPAPWLLYDPEGSQGDFLGTTTGLSIVIDDVTGDGVRDILVGSPFADVGRAEDRGEILVFQGGAAALAAGRPMTRLVLPAGLAHDVRGVFGWNVGHQGFQLADVTGDGLLDVLVVTPLADTPTRDTGAIYVWRSRPAPAPPAPLAEPFVGGTASGGAGAIPARPQPTRTADAVLLRPGSPHQDAQLGSGPGPGVRTEDVTGDGIHDLVVASPGSRFGPARGAVFVWRGGATLRGIPAPHGTLKAPGNPVNALLLGPSVRGHGLQVADVTGDGMPDVIAVEPTQGIVHVWRGGTGIAGRPAPRASLQFSPTGIRVGSLADHGLYLVDLDRDGALDVVTGQESPGAVVGVWFGGAALSGPSAQDAKLLPGQSASQTRGHSLRFEDWTEDGVLDVVLCAARSDSVFLWDGTSLSGDVPPTATWAGPGRGNGSGMGSLDGGEFFAQGLLTGDVTGDGVPDVVTAAHTAPRGNAGEAGAAFVFAGGAGVSGTLAPRAVLARGTPATEDRLGYVGTGQGLLLADLDDSGVLDIVVAGAFADGAERNEGRVLVWTEGAAGDPAPPAVVWSTGSAQAGSLLGFARGPGPLAADLTGDGRLELVVGAQVFDGAERDAGAVFLGSIGAAATTFTRLTVPAAKAGDQLGG